MVAVIHVYSGGKECCLQALHAIVLGTPITLLSSGTLHSIQYRILCYTHMYLKESLPSNGSAHLHVVLESIWLSTVN